MKKLVSFALYLFAFINSIYAQVDRGGQFMDSDDEPLSLEVVGITLVVGCVISFIGYLVIQNQKSKLLGQVLIGIGVIFALGTILRLIGLVLSIIIKIGQALLAVWILYQILISIYNWIKGPK